jgi:hypothetical protein
MKIMYNDEILEAPDAKGVVHAMKEKAVFLDQKMSLRRFMEDVAGRIGHGVRADTAEHFLSDGVRAKAWEVVD